MVHSFRNISIVLCSVLLLLVGISCNEETQFDPVNRDRTYLHFLNAFPGQEAVDITFETFDEVQEVASELRFLESWPNNGYASLLTSTDTINGKGGVVIRVMDHNTGEELVPPIFKNLTGGNQFTFVLMDSLGKPIVVRAIDRVDAEDPAAFVRLMNVNRFVQSASLQTKSGDEVIRSLNWLNYSSYQSVIPQTYTFYIMNDQTGVPLDSIPNVRLKFNKSYSFFLTHDAAGNPVAGLRELDSVFD